jgi:glycosyltransferase involved in cell wall biosynthesis
MPIDGKKSMNPLISTVIPTASRSIYLSRSIESALAGMGTIDVEVIVVPNGPDESWRQVLRPYQNNPAVRVVRVTEANANVARNAGLAEARGEFIRFLDDDDYLIPEGARKQYELIQGSGADVVSGSIRLLDAHGQSFELWQQPDVDDLCTAVLGPWRRCQPTAHVYRRSTLGNARWNPETPVRQDFEWLFDLCASTELRWEKTAEVVGVWQHHWQDRISSSVPFNDVRKLTVQMLMRSYETLLSTGRLNDNRRRAVAQGLWGCVHAAFFLEPHYWNQVARTISKIDSTARPALEAYNFPVLRLIDPLLIQWMLLPKRWLSHHARKLLRKLRLRHHW